MPALLAAGAALAQQAPVDLAPAAAAEKSAKPAKTAASAPLGAAEAVAGNAAMNCSLCKYRIQMVGYEKEVGAPQVGQGCWKRPWTAMSLRKAVTFSGKAWAASALRRAIQRLSVSRVAV